MLRKYVIGRHETMLFLPSASGFPLALSRTVMQVTVHAEWSTLTNGVMLRTRMVIAMANTPPTPDGATIKEIAAVALEVSARLLGHHQHRDIT